MNNRLSVQISLNGLSFLVTNPSKKEVFYKEINLTETSSPEEILLELESALAENPNLNTDFQKVSVIYDTSLYTIVPATLFDENKASDYLKFNSKILATDFIATEFFNSQEMVTVYVPFVNLNNYFFEKFGSFNYYHAVTILIEKLLLFEKNKQQKRVYVTVSKSMFHMVAFDNGELKLCNTYTYKTEEDFCYYILFTLEQLRYNADKIEVILNGQITTDSELYTLLYTYVRNINFMDEKESVITTDAFSGTNLLLKNLN